MARLASQAKMGYYPTPESVLALIKSMLNIENDPSEYAAFDPCCGTGEFVQAMPDGIRTYGNELNRERFQLAKQNVQNVIYGDGLWDITTTGMAYSCLWLNPPYDYGHDIEGRSVRMELQFLKATTKYLVRNGLLIYIVPYTTLNASAEHLAFNFKDIQVFPFPEDEYDAYKQVVLFGRRRQGKDEETAEMLKDLGNWRTWREPLPGPILDEAASEISFVLPPSREIKTFKSVKINEDDLQKIVNTSDLVVESLFTVHDTASIRVPMPLHKGHLAMLLASGYMNGEFKNDTDWYLVKGSTKKKQIEIIEGDTKRVRDKIEIVLKALDLNRGDFIDIK